MHTQNPIHALSAVVAVSTAAQLVSPAHAQCDAIDFEAYPPGTVLTTLAPGVEVDAIPDTCGGTVDVIVVEPFGGTSSGVRAITLEAGCPSFSPESLAIRFTEVQYDVTFTMATSTGQDVHVRAFSLPGGGGFIRYDNWFPTTDAVNGFVRVTNPEGFRRIEITAEALDFEFLDDLSYGADSTLPTAEIESPSFLQCFCGDDLIAVQGVACDDDGTYEMDILEYRPVNAPASVPWELVGSAAAPLCATGSLYVLSASDLPTGAVYLRVTVFNSCGLTQSAITVVNIDRSPPGISVDEPLEGATVCGVVDFCGAISDACPVTWNMKAIPEDGSGDSILIAEGEGGRCGLITKWSTTGVAPGAYVITITASDICGQVSTKEFDIFVDDECALDCGADLDGDGEVGVSDLLILLAAWGS